jgi:hypothetical protein
MTRHLRHLLLMGFTLPLTLPVLAQDTDTLGRLFMTPEKRLMLDRQRSLGISSEEGMATENMSLNGVVQRSSGHNSVWINQRMQYGEDKQGVRLQRNQPGTADVGTDRGTSVRLKVGDSVNHSTQERQNLVPPNAVQRGKAP